MSPPVLYSFRRCPYAMRARMAIKAAGLEVELREVVLRDKPQAMLEVSPKGTVPVLVLPTGQVLDESLDVMMWALAQHDPDGWLAPETGDFMAMQALIGDNDGPFKHHLDRFKYATRYEGADPLEHRAAAEPYLQALNERLETHANLFGTRVSYADIAIFPFVRQFANAASDYMHAGDFDALMRWLDGHVRSALFTSVMKKYPQWQAGDKGMRFPEA